MRFCMGSNLTEWTSMVYPRQHAIILFEDHLTYEIEVKRGGRIASLFEKPMEICTCFIRCTRGVWISVRLQSQPDKVYCHQLQYLPSIKQKILYSIPATWVEDGVNYLGIKIWKSIMT